MSELLKKPGLPTSDFKNVRSITNLTILSKIVARLVLARLKSHIAASLDFETEVANNAATTICDSCRLPHRLTDKLKTLGVTLDAIPGLCQPHREVIQLPHMGVCAIICCFISRDDACIVRTRSDYCNALLHGATKKSLKKLQRAQNKFA